jgi:AraC-like DNA-binding protein
MHRRDAPTHVIHAIGSFRSDRLIVSLSDYCAGWQQTWHAHEQPILTLILAGYAREQVGFQDVIVRPFHVGLKPAGLRHTDHFSPQGLRALRVSFSSSFLTELGGAQSWIERWDWKVASPAVRPLLRLAQCLRQEEPDEVEVMENLYESLAGLASPAPPRCPAEAPSWLRDAREHLDMSYDSGIRLTQLAQEANVHPVYFARQFRRFFGCSVGRYVRQRQFEAVASLLTHRQMSLAQIARHVGFSDQAHLTRTFASEFGITPGRFRCVAS